MIIKERQHLHWMIWVIALSLGYYGVKGGIFTIMHGGQFGCRGRLEPSSAATMKWRWCWRCSSR
jgi:hypothetical protein